MQTAGCINQHQIVVVGLGMLHALPGNLHRANLVAQCKNRYFRLLAQHLQLLDSRRPINIAGHQQRPLVLLFEQKGNFSGGSGFTTALQTSHHHNRGRLVLHINPNLLRAHQRGELLLHNFDNLLARGQAA